jgi:hypothetical protein
MPLLNHEIEWFHDGIKDIFYIIAGAVCPLICDVAAVDNG